MAFQSYIEDRGFDPVKVADATNKILSRSNDIIEQNQALAEIQFQQKTNLLNSLQSQRQKEKEVNSENHQLLMDSLKAAESTRQAQAKIDLDAAQTKRKFEEEKQQAQLEGIVQITRSLGEIGGAIQKDTIEQNQKELQAKYQDVLANANTGKYDAVDIGLDVKLSQLEGAELSNAALAIAKKELGPRSGWEKLLYSDTALDTFGKKLAIDNAVEDLTVGGGLTNMMLSNPEKTMPFVYDGIERQLKLGDITSLAGPEYRAAMTAFFSQEIQKVAGEAPEMLVHGAKKFNQWLNTESVQKNREAAAAGLKERNEQREALMFEKGGQSAFQFAKNFPLFSPGSSTGDGFNKVIQNLQFAPNPDYIVEQMGNMPDLTNPKLKFGRVDEFGKPVNLMFAKLKAKAIEIRRDTAQSNFTDQQMLGRDISNDIKTIALRDGVFNEQERNDAVQNLLDKVNSGDIDGVAARYAIEDLSGVYNDFSDKQLALKQLNEDADNFQLDLDVINSFESKGAITVKQANDFRAQHAEQAMPDEEGALGYGKDDVHKRFSTEARKLVREGDFTSKSFHYSADDAAIVATQLWKNDVALQMAKGTAKDLAQKQALTNVMTALRKGEKDGPFERTVSPNLGEQSFFNRYTPGPHNNSYTATEINLNSSEIGRRIADQPELLNDSSFTDLDGLLRDVARQVHKGQQLRLNKFAEDTWKASGLDFEEFWNTLLNREDSPYKGMKVRPGSYGAAKDQVQKSNPELLRYFENLTSERKNILLSNTNLISSEIGTGMPFVLGSISNVQRMGIKHPNVVAAISYIRTDGGSKSPESLPQFYQSISEEFNVDSYPTPEAFIAALPPPLQRDVNQVLTASNSKSNNHPLGSSKSNNRAMATQRRSSLRNELFRGATELGIDPVALGTIIQFESAGEFLSGPNRNGLDRYGGAGGEYLGWIQFSPDRAKQYGVSTGMNPKQMMDSVIRYMKDQGVLPGDGLHVMYQAVQAPGTRGGPLDPKLKGKADLVALSRKTGLNYLADENGPVSAHVDRMKIEHMPGITNFLKGN